MVEKHGRVTRATVLDSTWLKKKYVVVFLCRGRFQLCGFCFFDPVVSRPYEITFVINNTDEIVSRLYEIGTESMSYGWVISSFVRYNSISPHSGEFFYVASIITFKSYHLVSEILVILKLIHNENFGSAGLFLNLKRGTDQINSANTFSWRYGILLKKFSQSCWKRMFAS